MTVRRAPVAYVREADAPRLPPPDALHGPINDLRKNYFSSPGNSLVTVALGVLVVWLAWQVVRFALIDAVWTGSTREACLAGEGAAVGACWPFVHEKIGQWIYGFYPIAERWRVNTCFLVGAALLVPMLMPSAPYKLANALALLTAYPLFALILLTGGGFDLSASTYGVAAGAMLLAAAAMPPSVLGAEQGIVRNRLAFALAGIALLLWVGSFVADTGSMSGSIGTAMLALLAVAAILSTSLMLTAGGRMGRTNVLGWTVVFAAIMLALFLLDTDFGLEPVETAQWGGLTVTLVVSVTGIVASLPLGILLALGRRSAMPAVRFLSVAFIELVRGVPLITVLFMASVMLPLFLPPGMNFDKLLRALVGVALFSAAYMAEVVRGGLQAIPKGQYEGAMALGMPYWLTMIHIVLPQALRIAIPNIVSNFISLFKDTTLVLIIGVFDLLGIAQAALRDATWATPSTAPTGYLVLALIYWAFCFGMSRYAMFTERRLHTGHRT